MKRLIGFLAAAACAAAGCATAPSVRVDKDPGADLAAYQRFAFYSPLGTNRANYSTLTTTHLKHATREQLEKAGLTYDEANPQVLVNFRLLVTEKQELRSLGTGPFGWRGNLETVDYKAGALSVDLIDAKRNALVWQGTAEGRVGDKALQEPGAAMESAVAEIFRDFPNTRKTP
jgi:hypothetical protein